MTDIRLFLLEGNSWQQFWGELFNRFSFQTLISLSFLLRVFSLSHRVMVFCNQLVQNLHENTSLHQVTQIHILSGCSCLQSVRITNMDLVLKHYIETNIIKIDYCSHLWWAVQNSALVNLRITFIISFITTLNLSFKRVEFNKIVKVFKFVSSKNSESYVFETA